MSVRSRLTGVFVLAGACSAVACSAIVGIHDATELPPDGGSDDGSSFPEVEGVDARSDGSSTTDATVDGAESGGQGHDATVDGREPDGFGADVVADLLDATSVDAMAANDGAEGTADASDGAAVESDAAADVVDASSNVHDSATQATLDGSPDVQDAWVDVYDGAACGGSSPDESVGVFVDATSGADLLGCGTRQSPCLTIKAGISSAQAASKGTVYVAAGSYFGPVALAAGIRIQGGWTSQWTPVCTLPYSAVTITGTASGPATVSAVNLGGTGTLDTLTVLSKLSTEVDAGETVYGILAEGSTTSLVLNDVVVQTAAGGAGSAGAVGSVGVLPVTPDGGCTSGTGAVGALGVPGAATAAGAFSASGYVSTPGGTGGTGAIGSGGTAGGSGVCAPPGACDCLEVGTSGPHEVTCDPSPCAGDGYSGCGGGGGGGGAPGGGGGSSIGVFISGATVSATGGLLQSGNGGAGGPGGAGGTGSVGSAGTPGSSGICDTSCTEGQSSTICIPDDPETLAGGSPGGTGGTGGAGGPGAGGAGGSSCAYVVVGGSDAGVMWVGTRFVEGQAGSGGSPNGPAGVAKDQCP
jgi:hypothetical protein